MAAMPSSDRIKCCVPPNCSRSRGVQMRKHVLMAGSLVLVLAVAPRIAAHTQAGQTKSSQAKACQSKTGAARIPRMMDGKPDFSGVWGGPACAHNVGPNDTDTPLVTSFDAKKMSPLLPGVEAKFRQKPNGDLRHDDPTALCLPDGHPREVLAPYAQQFIQTRDKLVILYEYMHFFRVIPIGKPHREDVDLTFMGDSVAKWEGDTLVIDTIGLKEWTLAASNQWHSDALHTIERLRHID